LDVPTAGLVQHVEGNDEHNCWICFSVSPQRVKSHLPDGI